MSINPTSSENTLNSPVTALYAMGVEDSSIAPTTLPLEEITSTPHKSCIPGAESGEKGVVLNTIGATDDPVVTVYVNS